MSTPSMARISLAAKLESYRQNNPSFEQRKFEESLYDLFSRGQNPLILRWAERARQIVDPTQITTNSLFLKRVRNVAQRELFDLYFQRPTGTTYPYGSYEVLQALTLKLRNTQLKKSEDELIRDLQRACVKNDQNLLSETLSDHRWFYDRKTPLVNRPEMQKWIAGNIQNGELLNAPPNLIRAFDLHLRSDDEASILFYLKYIAESSMPSLEERFWLLDWVVKENPYTGYALSTTDIAYFEWLCKKGDHPYKKNLLEVMQNSNVYRMTEPSVTDIQKTCLEGIFAQKDPSITPDGRKVFSWMNPRDLKICLQNALQDKPGNSLFHLLHSFDFRRQLSQEELKLALEFLPPTQVEHLPLDIKVDCFSEIAYSSKGDEFRKLFTKYSNPQESKFAEELLLRLSIRREPNEVAKQNFRFLVDQLPLDELFGFGQNALPPVRHFFTETCLQRALQENPGERLFNLLCSPGFRQGLSTLFEKNPDKTNEYCPEMLLVIQGDSFRQSLKDYEPKCKVIQELILYVSQNLNSPDIAKSLLDLILGDLLQPLRYKKHSNEALEEGEPGPKLVTYTVGNPESSEQVRLKLSGTLKNTKWDTKRFLDFVLNDVLPQLRSCETEQDTTELLKYIHLVFEEK